MFSRSEILQLSSMANQMSERAPLSAALLSRMADDIDRGGDIARLLGTHPESTVPLFAIRALAAARWMSLTGAAPDLERIVTSTVDGHCHPDSDVVDAAWAALHDALFNDPDATSVALNRPVQQHLPRRGAMLLAGLGMVGFPRVRLLELGACAGLNLIVDRYHWVGPNWQWGDADSPVRLAVPTEGPGDVRIISRAGCDLAPQDPSDSDNVAVLKSFIPPEYTDELVELEGALTLATMEKPRIDRANAVDWLSEELLDVDPDASVCTVVWHSAFWNYLTPEDQAIIEDVLEAGARRGHVARVAYEPGEWSNPYTLQVAMFGR